MNRELVSALGALGLLYVAWRVYDDRPRGEREFPLSALICVAGAVQLYMRRSS